jgi:hypothetical protein
VDTTTDALPPRMVRTYSGFWPRRFYAGDAHYRHVGYQQDRRASG